MPVSLLDLPDELLLQICDNFALDKDGKLDFADLARTACIGLNEEQIEDRYNLLRLCLTSKRLGGVAHLALYRVIRPCNTPPNWNWGHAMQNYGKGLLAANFRGCQSLFIYVKDGNELEWLEDRPTPKHLHFYFCEFLEAEPQTRFLDQLYEHPSISRVSLHLGERGMSYDRIWRGDRKRASIGACQILHAFIHLPSLRHLYIDGFLNQYKIDVADDGVSRPLSPLQTLHIFRDFREQEDPGAHRLSQFLEYVEMDKEVDFACTPHFLTWKRTASVLAAETNK